MKLAFYAPLKPPDHPVPSGDRAMARAVMAALQHTGADVQVASALRSRDGTGSSTTQTRLMAEADAALPHIIAKGRAAGWQAWITYHNYYKAPDLLGPAVADALGVPYFQIEATRARKRLSGPWSEFAARAEAACDAADVILYLTERDAEALQRDAPDQQCLIHLRPFLNRMALPAQAPLDGPMLAVGMMREGDKLASYALIAQTLSALPTRDWSLHIAGDGPAQSAVKDLMAPFGSNVVFRGELDAADLAEAYENASLLFWPGVNEAFGLTYLEAQAAGLPVVAQDRPGVSDVLAPGTYPAPHEGAAGLAGKLVGYLADPALRHRHGNAARGHVAHHHLLPAAATTLAKALADLDVAS